jgi:hypothetical protein
MAYKRKQDNKSAAALDELAKLLQELDMDS